MAHTDRYFGFCSFTLISNHVDDRSDRGFKKLGHVGAKDNKTMSVSQSGKDIKVLPEELQLTRFDIEFRCFVSQTPKFDKLSFVLVDESQLGRLVEHFGDTRNVI